MTYACTVKALIEPRHSITLGKLAESSFEIDSPIDGKTITIDSHEERQGDFHSLFVTARGFRFADEALHYGHILKKALLACGAKIQIGLSIGVDTGKLDRHGREVSPFALDFDGLITYEETDDSVPLRRLPTVWHFRMHYYSVEEFADELIQQLELASVLSDKHLLAIELYNLSHFEASQRARYLTLVYAVECMVEKASQPDIVINHLDELIQLTEEKFKNEPEEFLNTLKNGLGNLKNESISQACKSLVTKYLGETDAKLFTKHYNLRSRLVHDGDMPSGTNLATEVFELDSLLSRLISAVISINQEK